MRVEDVIAAADEITVPRASELMGLTADAIRWQLRHGRLVGRRIGREWVIPVLYDENGEAVFLTKHPKGAAQTPSEENRKTFADDVDEGGE
jgi:hypothetical protein